MSDIFSSLDGFMRAALVAQFFGLPIVRSLFAGMQWGKAKGRKWNEPLPFVIGAIPFAVALFYTLGAYLFSFERPWMTVDLPDALRWFGLAASLVACGYLIWVFKTIGVAGAKVLVTFDDMELVTTGPYSKIRHPMYLGFGLWGITWLLFTESWPLAASWVGFMIFLAVLRVPREEQMLIEHFGEAYREYSKRTNRFFP